MVWKDCSRSKVTAHQAESVRGPPITEPRARRRDFNQPTTGKIRGLTLYCKAEYFMSQRRRAGELSRGDPAVPARIMR